MNYDVNNDPSPPPPTFVIDASVWVSHFIAQEIHHIESREWLTQAIRDNFFLVAPVLLIAEVTAAITRRTNQPTLGQLTLEFFGKVPNLRLVAMDRRMAGAAAHVAINHQLKGADAFYVALAYQLNVPLITWDIEQKNRTIGLITAQEPTP